MADEQRERAPAPANDPDAAPEPEASATEPSTEAVEATETAASNDSEASAPILAAEAPGPEVSTPAPDAEVVEPEASAAAPAVEPSNPEADIPAIAAESSVAEASAPALAAETVEPAASPLTPAVEPSGVDTDALVAAAGAAALTVEGADTLVGPTASPVGETSAEAAVEATEEEQPTKGRRAITFFREFVETILLTLVIFVAVRTLVVNFRVDGESMHPTLLNGEYLLVNRATYFHFDLNALRNILPGPDRQDRDVVYLFGPPARGDIIVFEPPFTSDKPFVKRVIGLPGDTIAIREDHRVYVNGQPLDEQYIAAPPQNLYPPGGGTYTVPPGMIFVMGDNRNNSLDSRSFSAVSMDSVIGKAVVTYWPLDVFGFVPHQRYALAGDKP